MKTRMLTVFAVALMAVGIGSPAQAIVWGEEDLEGKYPHVASVRGIRPDGSAWWSCVGSLLHVDDDKFVILTASHCTEAWAAYIPGILETVGVSFDQNNVVGDSYSDGKFYVRGGEPISFPGTRVPENMLDFGLVVFPRDAVNSEGETVEARWGWDNLPEVVLPPYAEYLTDLISAHRGSGEPWYFTAVGYGVGETFPTPGEETGPAQPNVWNLETFPKRYFADSLAYRAYNPITGILHFSQNVALIHNGTCGGDSGGPIFYDDPALGHEVLVALTTGGDRPCRATTVGPAISLQEAFDFIECGKVAGGVDDVKSCVEAAFSF